MHIFCIELLPGRSQEQKQSFMEQVTQIACEILNWPVETVDVIFTAVSSAGWAHAGKFYQPMPNPTQR